MLRKQSVCMMGSEAVLTPFSLPSPLLQKMPHDLHSTDFINNFLSLSQAAEVAELLDLFLFAPTGAQGLHCIFPAVPVWRCLGSGKSQLHDSCFLPNLFSFVLMTLNTRLPRRNEALKNACIKMSKNLIHAPVVSLV